MISRQIVHRKTRCLSQFELRVKGKLVALLSAQVVGYYESKAERQVMSASDGL